jgi:hypothetical protein
VGCCWSNVGLVVSSVKLLEMTELVTSSLTETTETLTLPSPNADITYSIKGVNADKFSITTDTGL